MIALEQGFLTYKTMGIKLMHLTNYENYLLIENKIVFKLWMSVYFLANVPSPLHGTKGFDNCRCLPLTYIRLLIGHFYKDWQSNGLFTFKI